MLKRIIKHPFVKKTSVLFSGSLVTSAIGLLGFFIVAKLYTTDTLGSFYMFISIITILSTIANFGYTQAIPLLDDSETKDMYSSIFLLATIIIFLFAPVILYLNQYGIFILFITLLNTYISIVDQSFVRDQRVHDLNIIRVGKIVLTLSFVILSFYIFGDNLDMLIYVHFVSSMIFVIYLKLKYFQDIKIINFNSNTKVILKKYIRFPKFIGPGMIFHQIAYQIPILIAGSYFSPSVAANYNMAFKLVYTPASLVSSAISQVYMGDLSKKNRNGENIFHSLKKISLGLFLFAIFFVIAISLVLPYIVNTFFDAQWSSSIDMSMALLPLIFALISIAPLTSLFQFTNNQKYIFTVHLFSMLIAFSSFAIAVYAKDFLLGVQIFAIVMFIRYIFLALKLKGLNNENH